METQNFQWPNYRQLEKRQGILPQLTVSTVDARMNCFNWFAYQQVGYITAQQLYALKQQQHLKVKVVDCQDMHTMTFKIKDAILFEVPDQEPSDYNEIAFKDRRDHAKGYGATDLFPSQLTALPDAVIFNCEYGQNRSVCMAYWYAKHVARTYPINLADYEQRNPWRPRIYVLEKGLYSISSESQTIQNALLERHMDSGSSKQPYKFTTSPNPFQQTNVRGSGLKNSTTMTNATANKSKNAK